MFFIKNVFVLSVIQLFGVICSSHSCQQVALGGTNSIFSFEMRIIFSPNVSWEVWPHQYKGDYQTGDQPEFKQTAVTQKADMNNKNNKNDVNESLQSL